MSTSTAAVPLISHDPRDVAKKPRISPEEQALRVAAVAGANGHNAMEGFFGSPLLTELQNRYIVGEIEIEDAIQALKKSLSVA